MCVSVDVCAVLPFSASGAPAAIEAPSQGDGSADPGTMEPVRSPCHGDAAKADGILFLSRRPGGARDDNYDIYRAELDGSNVRRVTDPAMSPDCRWVASVRASQPLSPRSLLRPASDNVVFGIGDDNPGQYDRLQHGENPLRVHGVPTWQDSSTLLSYRWDSTGKGWRIIRYRLDSQDNSVEVMDLGAPIGGEDLLPLAYSEPGRQ